MKNKFLPELNKFGSSSETLDPPNHAESHMMTYILDASRVEEWDQNVLIPAQNILSG
jgi:hypothetical protein